MRDDDEFFVGYLPTPPRTKRFAWTCAGLAFVALAGVGGYLSALRTAPAAASFDSGQEVVGLLQVDAYGILWAPDDSPSGARAYLLSRGGKLGFPDFAREHDGHVVRMRGGILDRGGYVMLEMNAIERADDALEPEVVARLRALPREDLGAVTRRGEIVDSKCHLGRMRPGNGRTHRACAQYCIRGGVPPVLVTSEQGLTHYLLVGRDGGEVNDAVIPFVAEPVELAGTLERRGDLLILAIDPAAIRRL